MNSDNVSKRNDTQGYPSKGDKHNFAKTDQWGLLQEQATWQVQQLQQPVPPQQLELHPLPLLVSQQPDVGRGSV